MPPWWPGRRRWRPGPPSSPPLRLRWWSCRRRPRRRRPPPGRAPRRASSSVWSASGSSSVNARRPYGRPAKGVSRAAPATGAGRAEGAAEAAPSPSSPAYSRSAHVVPARERGPLVDVPFGNAQPESGPHVDRWVDRPGQLLDGRGVVLSRDGPEPEASRTSVAWVDPPGQLIDGGDCRPAARWCRARGGPARWWQDRWRRPSAPGGRPRLPTPPAPAPNLRMSARSVAGSIPSTSCCSAAWAAA